jgi:hypothetical protein
MDSVVESRAVERDHAGDRERALQRGGEHVRGRWLQSQRQHTERHVQHAAVALFDLAGTVGHQGEAGTFVHGPY